MMTIKWEEIYGELLPPKPSLKKQKLINMESDINNNNNSNHGTKNIYRIRHLYRRAIHVLKINDGLQYVGQNFIEFERICGDLKSFNDATIRYNKRLNDELKRSKKDEQKRMKTKKRKFNQTNDENADPLFSFETTANNDNNNDKQSSLPKKKQKTKHKSNVNTTIGLNGK